MSTRCQIGFYNGSVGLDEPGAMIYRHCDGYPDTEYGVIAELMPLLQEFIEKRGFWHDEYCAAFVLARFLSDPGQVTGYGVSQQLHGDIEYFYAINGRDIVVYRTGESVEWSTMREVLRVMWRDKDAV